jgi:hypothetical protein
MKTGDTSGSVPYYFKLTALLLPILVALEVNAAETYTERCGVDAPPQV